MARPSRYRKPVEQLTSEALVKTHGNLYAAAQILGCSRQNVNQTISRYPVLQQLCRDLLEEEIDTHEATLRKLAIEKEQAVPVLAFLNNRARHRGWGRPGDADAPPAGSLHLHQHIHLASGGLEQLARIPDNDLDAMITTARRSLDHAEPALIEINPPAGQPSAPDD